MRPKLGPWALAATFIMIAGCGHPTAGPESGEKQPVIGVSLLNLSSEFIVMIDRAMQQRAEELGVRLIVGDAQRSAERQIQQAETFIAQQVDAMVLNPCELEASSPAVDKAIAAGIPVVNVNSETKSVPTAFVGSRDEESGRIAMEYIAQRLGGSGGVVIMQGYMGQAAQLRREAGAREILAKHPQLRLLAEQTAEWDRAKAMTLMENWLQSHGEKIQAVFAQNDEMAMGALLAIERANLKDKIIVVGVDAIADAMQAVRDGRLDATVFQNAAAQGRTAIDTAVAILRNEPFETEVFIPFQLVTRDNIDQFSMDSAN